MHSAPSRPLVSYLYSKLILSLDDVYILSAISYLLYTRWVREMVYACLGSYRHLPSSITPTCLALPLIEQIGHIIMKILPIS